MGKSIRNPALSKIIIKHIKDYIVSNNLQAGDPLPSEGELAEELGVSRSPVREAVKSLQSLGIIEVRQGDGLYVREWNFNAIIETLNYGARIKPKTIYELYQIRVWLEIAVIGDVIKRISDLEIDQLEILMLRWNAAIKNGEDYVVYDEAFHNAMHAVLKNETLMMFFKVFWVAFDNIGEEEIRLAAEPLSVLKEHRLIFEAIKHRDAELARRALKAQFTGFMERIQKNVEDKEQQLKQLVEVEV